MVKKIPLTPPFPKGEATKGIFSKRENPLQIDFLTGALSYRQKKCRPGNELLGKAVGIKSNYKPTIVDATAGLGRDAFILACLGCPVLMLERSPTVAKLLEEALHRLITDPHFSKKISLTMRHIDAKCYFAALTEIDRPDVIYLDPMFPHRTKSALVKKELRQLREIVGNDEDAAELLTIALKVARKRVVVKRPRLAPTLTHLKPDFVISGKAQRFDVYTHYP